jgi:aldose 1-epimerase
MPPDRRLRLRHGPFELDLAPELGGAIAGFRVRSGDGYVPLMRETPADASDVLQTACFPLIPYCNRIRDGRFSFDGHDVHLAPNLPPQKHPLHGQGWRGSWQVEDAGEGTATLAYDYPGGDWPWPWRGSQAFRLDDAGLRARLSCTNAGHEPMPCGLGFHPFFDAPPDTWIDARVNAVWTVDAEVMPVERIAPEGRYSLDGRSIARAGLDNGYDGWSGEALLRWPSRGVGLRISSPTARRFQVYAPADQDVICAEPVENANDALSRPEADWRRLGITILAPGETATLEARYDLADGA